MREGSCLFVGGKQAGFRKFKSTTDHLVFLAEHMKRTLRPRNRGMFATFFDVKKAFDRVWHTKLLHQLTCIGLSGHIYDMIRDFLSNRTMEVKCGQAISAPQFLDMGTPQGAVLSPTLFAIMLHDIDKVHLNDQKLMMFADDITIISDNFRFTGARGLRVQQLAKHQQAIDKIAAYMCNLGFEFSAEKTQFMVATRQNLSPYPNINIKVNGEEIRPSKSVKYLGITFNYRLSWGEHVQTVVRKANKATNVIKCLATESWTKSDRGSRFLLNIVRSLVRSVLSYGQEAFFSLSISEKRALDRAERVAIKVALGLPPSASTIQLHKEVQWLTLDEERQLRCAQYYVRAFSIKDNPAKEVLLPSFGVPAQFHHRSPRYLVRTLPIAQFTDPLLHNTPIKVEHLESWEPSSVPPWEQTDPKLEYSLPPHITKNSNTLLAGVLANAKIERDFSNHFQLYTDGSVHEDGKTGCAVVSRAIGNSRFTTLGRYKLSPHLSTFSTEMTAIGIALDAAENLERDIANIAIMTDSMSSLQAIAAPLKHRFKAHNYIHKQLKALKDSGKVVTFLHVPSHCGVTGNDKADLGANQAAGFEETNFLSYTRGEAYASLQKTARRMFKTLILFPQQTGIRHDFHPSWNRTLRRIRCCCTLYAQKERTSTPILCRCGTRFSLAHFADEPCGHLQPSVKGLRSYMATNELNFLELPVQHEELGWEPARQLCLAIHASPMAFAF